MAQDIFTFHTHCNHILPFYLKESAIYPYILQYHFTPSLPNNPYTDSYQDQTTPTFLNQSILIKITRLNLSTQTLQVGLLHNIKTFYTHLLVIRTSLFLILAMTP